MMGGARRSLPTRAKILLPLALLLLVALSVKRLLLEPRPPVLWELAGATMGTTWSARFWSPGDLADRLAELQDSIAAELELINRQMSTYDSSSELSVFNASRDTLPHPLAPATISLLLRARQISDLTGGAFDVTVAPLVAAWGFGAAAPARPTPPAPDELADLSRRVGYRLLDIDSLAGTARKSQPEIMVDLSAIAKGYGVDRMAGALRRAGVANYLVEIGGELLAAGVRPDGGAWRVAIERPADLGERAGMLTLELADLAVATSGDYRNYYEYQGERLSHIIDPRTLRPASHAGASVTVLHPQCATADAWATALSVLGPEEGLALAERSDLAALFIVRNAGGFELLTTTAFTVVADTASPEEDG